MDYSRIQFLSLVCRKNSDWNQAIKVFSAIIPGAEISVFSPECDSWGTVDFIVSNKKFSVLCTKDNFIPGAKKLDENWELILKGLA